VCVLSAMRARHSVQKIHRYKCCSVVATCVSGFGVCKLPEDGPNGPKHVGANIEIF
jgi:hypothetical protein